MRIEGLGLRECGLYGFGAWWLRGFSLQRSFKGFSQALSGL